MRPDIIDPLPSTDAIHDARWEFPPGVQVRTGQLLLSGPGIERLPVGGSTPRKDGHVTSFEEGGFLGGYARLPVNSATLEARTYDLYQSILGVTEGRTICRFWNYVPEINRVNVPLIENYKLFCSGRARAFADVHGADHPEFFPAASATGTKDRELTVVFLATDRPVENWENPNQTPAYNYPKSHGPRSPSFARASQCIQSDGSEWTFVSGTAGIKGHKSQCAGDFTGQLEVTLENLDLILQYVGLRLGEQPQGKARFFKAFLRNVDDLPELRKRLAGLLGKSDTLAVVQGDICRADLDVELEITVYPKG